jgi:hypothetical protein
MYTFGAMNLIFARAPKSQATIAPLLLGASNA